MINTKAVLTVLHDDNSVFANYSKEAAEYQRDYFVLPLAATDDALYLGFEKPFSSIFASLKVKNIVASTLTAEYYNSKTSAWAALTISDDTKGFTRDGFIQWSNDATDWGSVAVNSITNYYIRIKASVTLTTTTAFNGINIVFSDDFDLKEEFPNIDRFLLTGQTSFILFHVATRNQIVQELISRGFIKHDAVNGWQTITPFDLLRINEVRLASLFLTLSKILREASDDPQGNLISKADYYEGKYKEQMLSQALTVDIDNDGKTDENEKLIGTSRTVNR